MSTFYITTTIPYVNAAAHLGHALEFVQADVIARHQKLAGKEVYFLSGTDENAIKNVQAAEEAGMPVEEFVEKNSQTFRGLLEELNISTDQFIRTTEARHKKGAQALWDRTDKRYIYKKKYQGLYCVGCELFYKPEELDENKECFEHPGKKLEETEEENYFFRLSEFTSWLVKLIANEEVRIVPEGKKNEVLAFIEHGLEDFSISRPVERSRHWGVPVPGDDSQTMYVWYDALANYITALGYPDEDADLYRRFWKEGDHRVHVLGKGVSRFHAVYWPAMLNAANLPLPTLEFVHGYITVNGQKMSKSLGNRVDPFEVIAKYGTDALRYFFLRELPPAEDGDFSQEKFEARYKADLASGLGNLVARVLTVAKKANVKSEAPALHEFSNSQFQTLVDETAQKAQSALGDFRFNEALAAIWEIIHFCDKQVDEKRPWENSPEQKTVIADLLGAISEIARLLQAFLPETSERILAQLKGGERQPLFPALS